MMINLHKKLIDKLLQVMGLLGLGYEEAAIYS